MKYSIKLTEKDGKSEKIWFTLSYGKEPQHNQEANLSLTLTN